MIKTIQILLQNEEYSLKESDEKIVLFEGSLSICPEEYIVIKKENLVGKFVVSEVHRNIERIVLDTKKKEEAAIYAVIIYKKLFDNIVNRVKARNIRDYLNLGDKEKALAYSVQEFNDTIYSINDEEPLKISLIYFGDHVEVKFSGEYLAKGANLGRGFVVFYNYCEKLKYISCFCDEIERKLNFNIAHEKISKLYILGHL